MVLGVVGASAVKKRPLDRISENQGFQIALEQGAARELKTTPVAVEPAESAGTLRVRPDPISLTVGQSVRPRIYHTPTRGSEQEITLDSRLRMTASNPSLLRVERMIDGTFTVTALPLSPGETSRRTTLLFIFAEARKLVRVTVNVSPGAKPPDTVTPSQPEPVLSSQILRFTPSAPKQNERFTVSWQRPILNPFLTMKIQQRTGQTSNCPEFTASARGNAISLTLHSHECLCGKAHGHCAGQKRG